MNTASEYLIWLNDLSEKSDNEKTRKSIQRLTSLLNELDSKKVFEKDASKIVQRLEVLNSKIEKNPGRIKFYVNSCTSAIVNISAKFYKLVGKNYYQNEYLSVGSGFGVAIGSAVYVFTNDVTYLALGVSLGVALGIAFGSIYDKKAEKEERVLTGR